jgi:hypothetical protein
MHRIPKSERELLILKIEAGKKMLDNPLLTDQTKASVRKTLSEKETRLNELNETGCNEAQLTNSKN